MPKLDTTLTQAAIKRLKCAPGRRSTEYTVDPIQVPGLFVEVRHSGAMTYYLRYRDADQATRYSKIGKACGSIRQARWYSRNAASYRCC